MCVTQKNPKYNRLAKCEIYKGFAEMCAEAGVGGIKWRSRGLCCEWRKSDKNTFSCAVFIWLTVLVACCSFSRGMIKNKTKFERRVKVQLSLSSQQSNAAGTQNTRRRWTLARSRARTTSSAPRRPASNCPSAMAVNARKATCWMEPTASSPRAVPAWPVSRGIFFIETPLSRAKEMQKWHRVGTEDTHQNEAEVE